MRRIFLTVIAFLFFYLTGISQEKVMFMDFSFITTTSEKAKLYEVKAPYTLLYFYNPECEDCTKIKKELSKSRELNKLIEQGFISVLAILPDVEKEYWLDKKKFIPKQWKNCWIANDKPIIQTYLRTLPTFYLLDKEKYIFGTPNSKDLLKWIKLKADENIDN